MGVEAVIQWDHHSLAVSPYKSGPHFGCSEYVSVVCLCVGCVGVGLCVCVYIYAILPTVHFRARLHNFALAIVSNEQKMLFLFVIRKFQCVLYTQETTAKLRHCHCVVLLVPI